MEYKEFVRISENSKTAVVFIHGFLETPHYFSSFFDSIPEQYSIYGLLLDGHGKDMRDFSKSSMKKWEKDVKSKFDELIKEYENIIIIAHSMGTLFAIEQSLLYPKKIKSLILLAVPFKVRLKPNFCKNILRMIFKKSDNQDMIDMRNACGCSPPKSILDYFGLIPRGLEVSHKGRIIRKSAKNIQVKSYVYQSSNDDIVSISSHRYFDGNENVKVKMLSNSFHLRYDNEDFNIVNKRIKKVCKEALHK